MANDSVDPQVVASVETALEHKAPITANLPWRARVAIVALILVIIILVAQAINNQKEIQDLQKANQAKLEKIEADRAKQVADLSALLTLVKASEERAKAAGQMPAVTVEQAVEALKKSGFTEEVIKEAVQRASGKQGATGPQGPQGPPGSSAAATTSSTVPATTTSTTQRPSTTTSSTTTTRPTPQPKPCTVGLDVPGLAKVCL